MLLLHKAKTTGILTASISRHVAPLPIYGVIFATMFYFSKTKNTAQLLLLLLLRQIHSTRAIEPISMGMIGVGLFMGYKGILKDQTWCRVTECCNDHHIPADVDGKYLAVNQKRLDEYPLNNNYSTSGLKSNLTNTLFGQHIVQNHLIPALQSHYSNLGASSKALVLSFHGTPGTGKNFVADRIAEYLYRSGARSAYVKKYLGRLHFPEASRAEEYAVRFFSQFV